MSKPKRSIAHVVPEPGAGKHWAVFYYASDDPVGEPPGIELYNKKSMAIATAVAWAKEFQPSQVYIHGKDGRIQSERTYPRSSDPNPPAGVRRRK